MTDSTSPELALFAVSQDQGPFHKLGQQFTAVGARYLGPVVVSPVAIYFVKKARNNQTHGFGLIGAMVSAALTKKDPISTCLVSDLPAPIRSQLDPKGKLAAKDVVIVPRSTVSFVKTARFNNSLVFTAGQDKFTAVTGLFRGRKTRLALAQMDWQLDTPLTPTIAPAHDLRSPEERQTATALPLWKRALLIVGAIIIFIAVIALQIALRH